MRTFRIVAALCASVALLCFAIVSSAAVGLTNHVWRYDQSGLNLGTAWRAPDYDDSSWLQGRGIHARESGPPAILSLTNTILALSTNGSGPSIITYYFRTHFTLTNDPALETLVVSNCFDDGGVVYLNGAEVFRLNMPAGNISSSTLASSAGPNPEGTFIVTNIPSEKLVLGDNVIAVEVHQVSAANGDVVFGFSLTTTPVPPTALVITKPPRNRIVEEGQRVCMKVENGRRYKG